MSSSILVVDDEPQVSHFLERVLKDASYVVSAAENGRQALARIQAENFDLILLDILMPDMDGLETTANIRAREQATGDHLPIIAMTAHVMQGDRERCLEAGMDDYIAKPIQAEALFTSLERLLPAVVSTASEASPPVAAPVTVLFDKASTLRRVDGDRELLREVVQLFSEACTEMLDDIDSAIENQDARRLRQSAHTLKGEASNFGATATVVAASQLEMMGRDEDFTQACAAYTELENALARLIPALIAFGEEEEPA